MSETTGVPEISGIALFSEKKFTGHTLNKKESIIIQVIQKKTWKIYKLSYTWEKDGKSYPVTVELGQKFKKNGTFTERQDRCNL